MDDDERKGTNQRASVIDRLVIQNFSFIHVHSFNKKALLRPALIAKAFRRSNVRRLLVYDKTAVEKMKTG
jgi:hypothetical protein